MKTRDNKGRFIKGHKINKGKIGFWRNKKKAPMTDEVKKKISIGHKGLPSKKKGKPAYNMRGEKHWNWQGGIWNKNNKIRHSIEYKLWRTAVFERDSYICKFCGQVGGRLNADHIKSFSLYPELRFAIDNGRTLCEECHKKTTDYLLKQPYKNRR